MLGPRWNPFGDHTQRISFRLGDAQTQFERIYRFTSGNLSQADVWQLHQEMMRARRDAQQIAHQQRVLQQYSALQMQQMQAAAMREQTLRQAEEVVLRQVAMDSFQRATTLAPVGHWESGPQLSMQVRGRR